MITTPLPRLRHGLTICRQAEAAVIRDDVRRKFFRLGEVECFLVERFDGVTTVEAALTAAEQRFDGVLPREALERFLDSLRRAGLLEGAADAPVVTAPSRRRLRGNPLYLRIPLVDPDRALGWLARRLRFLYSRAFVALSLLAILAAVAVAIAGWPDIVGDARSSLYRLSAIPAIWFTVLAVVAAHECAHALTCKHFGGEVHEMGLMLIYLQPAAYCNVSDAWMFPEKRHRLLVTLAGPYFELCLWALATLAWRVTDPETGIHFLALIVVVTSGLKVFINLNPFLKLDGYYLLSDALEMPNLRRRGFRHVGDRLRALFGRPASDAGETPPRERRILLVYGLVATVLSLGFLGFAVAKLGRYVVQDRMLTFAMALGLLGMKLPRRVSRLFGKGDSGGMEDGDDDEDDAEPALRNGKHDLPKAVPDHARPGRPPIPRRVRVAAAWLAGAALVVGLLVAIPAPLKVRGPFLALPRHNADVRTLVDGIVDQVLVDEGQTVKPGDVLARLSTTDVDAQLGDLDAEIATGRARLALLEAGPRHEDVEVAAAALATAEGHLPYARDRLAMNRSLSESGIISKQDLRLSEEQAVTAEHQVTEARKRLGAVSRGPRPEETAAARAEIAALEFRRGVLQDQRRLLQITSPTGGVVATPALQLHELIHQDLKKGDLVAEVVDNHVLTAEIAVPEQDIADVRVGQPVLLKARARPELTFHGTVTALGVTARAEAGPGSTASASSSAGVTAVTAKRVMVRTQIDNRDLLLRPEMTGEAKIVCGRRSAWSLLTRGLARTFRVEFWSWS